MKKYGDSVVYVRDGVAANALVQQSKGVEGKELLTLVLLDPKLEGQLMTGVLGNKAVQVLFDVPPLSEEKGHGWQANDDPTRSTGLFTVTTAELLRLSVAIINNGGSDLVVSPDAVVNSARTLISRLADKLAETTEGKDAELQKLADEHAKYPDGDVLPVVPEEVISAVDDLKKAIETITAEPTEVQQFVEQLKNEQPPVVPEDPTSYDSVIAAMKAGGVQTNEAPLGEELSEAKGPSDSAPLPASAPADDTAS